MNRMFIRFGLPWLIFGSAIFALYWTIWHGESAVSYTPTADFAQHSSKTQPARHASAIRTSKDNRAQFATSNQPISSEAATPINAPVTGHAQQTPAPVPRRVDLPEKSTAEQNPQTIETNLHQALQDVDPRIRYHALAQSDAQGMAASAHTLQQLATSDRDPAVRVLAMTKFSQDPAIDPAMVRAVAEAGLRDSDATVRAHAREMLEQLDQASRSNDEPPQLLSDDATVQ